MRNFKMRLFGIGSVEIALPETLDEMRNLLAKLYPDWTPEQIDSHIAKLATRAQRIEVNIVARSMHTKGASDDEILKWVKSQW